MKDLEGQVGGAWSTICADLLPWLEVLLGEVPGNLDADSKSLTAGHLHARESCVGPVGPWNQNPLPPSCPLFRVSGAKMGAKVLVPPHPPASTSLAGNSHKERGPRLGC